jgi:hypothetical protein
MRRRRDDRWAPPPPGGKPPTEPVEPIDLYPNPLPPPGPPVTRESTLADLQTGFAALTDDELKLARLWLVGETVDDACYILRLREKQMQKVWRSMRRKIRRALLDDAERAAEGPRLAPPVQPKPDAPQGTGDAAPP